MIYSAEHESFLLYLENTKTYRRRFCQKAPVSPLFCPRRTRRSRIPASSDSTRRATSGCDGLNANVHHILFMCVATGDANTARLCISAACSCRGPRWTFGHLSRLVYSVRRVVGHVPCACLSYLTFHIQYSTKFGSPDLPESLDVDRRMWIAVRTIDFCLVRHYLS